MAYTDAEETSPHINYGGGRQTISIFGCGACPLEYCLDRSLGSTGNCSPLNYADIECTLQGLSRRHNRAPHCEEEPLQGDRQLHPPSSWRHAEGTVTVRWNNSYHSSRSPAAIRLKYAPDGRMLGEADSDAVPGKGACMMRLCEVPQRFASKCRCKVAGGSHAGIKDNAVLMQLGAYARLIILSLATHKRSSDIRADCSYVCVRS